MNFCWSLEWLDPSCHSIWLARRAENCTRWNVLHEAKDFITLRKIKELCFWRINLDRPRSVFLVLWPQSWVAQPPTEPVVSTPYCEAELISASEAFPNYWPKDIDNSGPSSIIILSTFPTQRCIFRADVQHVESCSKFSTATWRVLFLSRVRIFHIFFFCRLVALDLFFLSCYWE